MLPLNHKVIKKEKSKGPNRVGSQPSVWGAALVTQGKEDLKAGEKGGCETVSMQSSDQCYKSGTTLTYFQRQA